MADFTQTERDKIEATLADIKSRTEQPYGVISIDPDDKPFADGYAMMAELLAHRLDTDNTLDEADRQELQNVQNWFSGAEKINRGVGAFSVMIRTYSDVQSQLRFNKNVTDAKMQEASNKIGLNAFKKMVGDFALGKFIMPNMAFIAKHDAIGAAQVLFDEDESDTAHHRNGNSAWSGVPLFSVLGSDQTGRVLGVDDEFNTINDLRDTMFMVESFRQAFTATVDANTKLAAKMVALAGNLSTGRLAKDLATELLKEMGLFASPELIINFAKELSSYESCDYEDIGIMQVVADSFLLAMTNGEVAYASIKKSIQSGSYNSLKSLQKYFELGDDNDIKYDNFIDKAHNVFKELTQDNLAITLEWIPETVNEVISLASSDSGKGLSMRYALHNLDSFIMPQADFTQHNKDGQLEKLSTDNPDGMSEMYIKDRATYVYYREADDGDGVVNDTNSPLPRNTVFEDLALGDQTAVIKNQKGGFNVFVFGANEEDPALNGLKYDDHIYGGGGNDTIKGGKGNDYLEGNQDTDNLYGDKGNDEIHGGTGGDYIYGASEEGDSEGLDKQFKNKLYGGDGSDWIYGGAGSDDLYNSYEENNDDQKCDILNGGTGHDKYYVDFHDYIFDTAEGDKQLGTVFLGEDKRQLTGGEYESSGVNSLNEPVECYQGNGVFYEWDKIDNRLTVKEKKDDVTGLVISNFTTGDNSILGIKLEGGPEGNGSNLNAPQPNDSAPNTGGAAETRSPIIIDLNGDGVKTANHSVYFDHGDDGFAEKTGWADKNDALLAWDKNGNGIIDVGSELFGNNTIIDGDAQVATNGFEALAELDSNEDGKIDYHDKVWSNLKLWQDSNEDGNTDKGELTSITRSQIQSIDLNYQANDKVDEQGNEHRETSLVTWQNGKQSDVTDVWFKSDPAFRIDKTTIDVSDDIKLLPNAIGFGIVSDLHKSLQQDAKLKQLVTDYTATPSDERTDEQLNQLIYQWTGSADIDPNSRDPQKIYPHVMDARMLVSLEHLTGHDYLGTWCWGDRDPNPHGRAAPKLIAEFQKFAEYVDAQLLMQSENQIVYNDLIDPTGINWQTFNQQINDLLNVGTFEEASKLFNTTKNLGAYNSHFNRLFNDNVSVQSISNNLWQKIAEMSRWINGTENDDSLSGTATDDVLFGGHGDDILHGKSGDDDYTFSLGFGSDRIYDSAGKDSIIFGANITPEMLNVTRDMSSVFISRLDDNGQLTEDIIQIENVFDFDGGIAEGLIEDVIFANGENWSWQVLLEKCAAVATNDDDNIYLGIGDDTIDASNGDDFINGGLGDDHLTGGFGNDKIDGGMGADTLIGGSGEDELLGRDGGDTLIGGEGDDQLDGGKGDDTLIGGEGNDQLDGGKGDDTYIFGRNFGKEKISDTNGINHLKFTDGLTQDDLVFNVDYDKEHNPTKYSPLIITTKEGDNQLIIEDYFQQEYFDQISFEDGTTLSVKDVEVLVLTGTNENDKIVAFDHDSTLLGLSGDDHLYGKGGNDKLFGGDGNDYLDGEDGEDILDGGAGNDTFIIGEKDTVNISDVSDHDNISLRAKNDEDINAAINIDSKLSEITISRFDFDDSIQEGDYSTFDRTHVVYETIDTIYHSDRTYDLDFLLGAVGQSIPDKSTYHDIIHRGNTIGTLSKPHGSWTYFYDYKMQDKWYLHFDGESTLEIKQKYTNENITLNIGDASSVTLKDALNNLEKYEHLKFNFSDKKQLTFSELLQKSLDDTITSENDIIRGFDTDDVLRGGDGNDSLQGGKGNDVIYAGSGDDILAGGYYSTYWHRPSSYFRGTLDYKHINTSGGGHGGSYRHGLKPSGYGDDTYILEGNYGNDVIIDRDETTGNNDTIWFKDIDNINDLLFRKLGDTLEIIDEKNDSSITIPYYFENDFWKIESFKFGTNDSFKMTESIIGELIKIPTELDDILFGTDNADIINGLGGDDKIKAYDGNDTLAGGQGDDEIEGGDGDDKIEGGEGNDRLEGDVGNDSIRGGVGNDSIRGGEGNDWLEGGKGNDYLTGGLGNDDFIFKKGWGEDTISGWVNTNNQPRLDNPDENNTIYFEDIQSNEIIIRRVDYGVLVQRVGSDDSLKINCDFADPKTFFPINKIIFANNEVWNLEQIYQHAVLGTEGEDEIRSITETDVINAGAGNDHIIADGDKVIAYGGSGDDLLEGGNQYLYDSTVDESIERKLYGEEGNDTLTGSGLLDGGSGNDTLTGLGELYGGIGKDILSGHGQLHGGLGNDTLTGSGELYGGSGIDLLVLGGDRTRPGAGPGPVIEHCILDGGEGDDILDGSDTPMPFGEEGAAYNLPEKGEITNTFIGGKGNDAIYGSFANDTYEFNLGDGNDTIVETKLDKAFTNIYASYDIIRLGEGINQEDISLIHRGNDLILQHKNGNDSITVKEHFNATNTAANHYKINEIQFADGGSLSLVEIENQAIWYGSDQADQMFGNEFDETICGGKGNDTLAGSTGNDTLDGGAGDDNYLYYSGDGQDIIDQTDGGRDVLFFQDVSKDRLTFSKDNNDLLIVVDEDESQSVRVKEHFLGGEKAISLVQPLDGYSITAAKINEMLNIEDNGAGNPGDGTNDNPNTGDAPSNLVEGKDDSDDQVVGTNGADHLRGLGGEDSLFGMGGNDLLEGGSGDDSLSGGNGSKKGSGNDILKGGAGNDTLSGEDGNDTLIGGSGDDKYLYSSGIDTIDNTGGGQDGVFFSGKEASRLSFHRKENDLVVLVDGDLKQQVRVKNHFLGGENAISYIQPGSGYSIMADQLVNKLSPLPNGDNTIGDNDNTGDNDTTVGTDGNDTITSTSANETLNGGAGDDTYLFKPNFGKDIVNNTGGGNDSILFEGMSFNEVIGNGFRKYGDDLILTVAGSDDQVTITEYFKDDEHTIETIKFSSGGEMSADQFFEAFSLNRNVSARRMIEDVISVSSMRSAHSMINAMASFENSSDNPLNGQNDGMNNSAMLISSSVN